MAAFIKQAEEYFEQNPDKNDFWMPNPDFPLNLLHFTREFIDYCNSISIRTSKEQEEFMNLNPPVDNNLIYRWDIPLYQEPVNLQEIKPDHE